MAKPFKSSFLRNQKSLWIFSFQDFILVAPLLSNVWLCIYALPDDAFVFLCNLHVCPCTPFQHSSNGVPQGAIILIPLSLGQQCQVNGSPNDSKW